MIWARAILLHLLQPSAQLRIELWMVDVTYHVVEPRFKVCPSRLAKVACVFRLCSCLPYRLAKLFSRHRRAANPENFELRVHATHTCQVVEARDQLSLGQIARSSKDDQDARISTGERVLRQLLEGTGLDNCLHSLLSIDAFLYRCFRYGYRFRIVTGN